MFAVLLSMVWCSGMYKLLRHVSVLVTYGFYKKNSIYTQKNNVYQGFVFKVYHGVCPGRH
jgi:hypothetical protein